MPENNSNLDKEQVSTQIIRNYSKYTNQDALGVLFYNAQANIMHPIIYDKNINWAIHERCCGSGYAAIATALSHQSKQSQTHKINQPGGYLDVRVEYENGALQGI